MEIQINFLLYWKWIIKRWKLIALLTIVFVIVSGYNSYFRVNPTYTATTTMLVQSARPNENVAYMDLMANQKLIKTYSDLIRSRQVAETVIRNLSLDNMSIESLLGKVRIDAPNDSLVAKITVTDSDPVRAAKIANGFGYAFAHNLLEIMKVDNASVLDEAEVNPIPTAPNPPQSMVMGGMGGMIVGVLLALVLGFLDKSVKSETEIEELLGIPVLGVIGNFNDEEKRKNKKKGKKRKRRGLSSGGVTREG